MSDWSCRHFIIPEPWGASAPTTQTHKNNLHHPALISAVTTSNCSSFLRFAVPPFIVSRQHVSQPIHQCHCNPAGTSILLSRAGDRSSCSLNQLSGDCRRRRDARSFSLFPAWLHSTSILPPILLESPLCAGGADVYFHSQSLCQSLSLWTLQPCCGSQSNCGDLL